MKSKFFTGLFMLCSFQELFCASKKFRPLSLVHPDALSESAHLRQDSPLHNPDFSDMEPARKASRAYVGIINLVQRFKLSEDLKTEEAFKDLCYTVERFKDEHFMVLVHNRLLHDGDHDPHYNPFNCDLIPELEKIANQHKFALGCIPFKVIPDFSDEEMHMVKSFSTGLDSLQACTPRSDDLNDSFDKDLTIT